MRYHLADLESDFSRFHRVDDMYSQPGPRMLRMAWRIAAYDGMMARRIEAQNHQPDRPAQRSTASSQTPSPTGGGSPERLAVGRAAPGTTVVPVSALALNNPDLIQIVKVPKKTTES